jgi:phosphatidylglycerol---prolipoprotein diacylglyceryl transferase
VFPILLDLGPVHVYAYGVAIMTGTWLAWFYARHAMASFGADTETISRMFVWGFVAAFVGGKVFYFLQAPAYYAMHPGEAMALSGSGFVFYGSFLFAVPTFYWFVRSEKLPVPAMFDIVTVCTGLIHGFGKIGCLLAGCCYGKPSEAGWWAITFTHPDIAAHPLNEPLYATQAYDAVVIFGSLALVLWIKRRGWCVGRLFLVYAMLYSVGRFFTEQYRGDIERGFVLNGLLSHSQAIAIGVILACAGIWLYAAKHAPRASIRAA